MVTLSQRIVTITVSSALVLCWASFPRLVPYTLKFVATSELRASLRPLTFIFSFFLRGFGTDPVGMMEDLSRRKVLGDIWDVANACLVLIALPKSTKRRARHRGQRGHHDCELKNPLRQGNAQKRLFLGESQSIAFAICLPIHCRPPIANPSRRTLRRTLKFPLRG